VTPTDARLGARPILDVRDLHIVYRGRNGEIFAVQGTSLRIGQDESVGLVGESGSGKSTLARALLGLLPTGHGFVERGDITIDDTNVTHLTADEWPAFRGRPIAMVFQDSISFLNPVMRVSEQIAESVRRHDPSVASAPRVRELLDLVRLPASVARAYPFELSGGMRQRVGIAIALACKPQLLVADEPTTALDVTTQAEILALLVELRQAEGMSLLLISHDLGVVRAVCDRVYIMYAGHVVESGATTELFAWPRHPYLMGLMEAARTVQGPDGHFATIEGEVPDLKVRTTWCPFVRRCPQAMEVCGEAMPAVHRFADAPEHDVRCWLYSSG
jgi:oligopeptide/dipeptide ABC transporter ATP-binding protein